MMTLMEAAQAIYAAARREKMVIATVAERASDGPVLWFAHSIASVVPVYREGPNKVLTKISVGEGGDSRALFVEKRDYQTYVRWARTMQ